jgi:hypothetical protein
MNGWCNLLFSEKYSDENIYGFMCNDRILSTTLKKDTEYNMEKEGTKLNSAVQKRPSSKGFIFQLFFYDYLI